MKPTRRQIFVCDGQSITFSDNGERLTFVDGPSLGFIRKKALIGQEQLAAARERLQKAERWLPHAPIGDNRQDAAIKEWDAARREVDRLSFLFGDAAAPGVMNAGLRELNKKNADFWQGRAE